VEPEVLNQQKQKALVYSTGAVTAVSLLPFLIYVSPTHLSLDSFARSTFIPWINPLTPELNPSAQRYLTRFLLVIVLIEPCISLIYA
jgi:hypothetical protein